MIDLTEAQKENLLFLLNNRRRYLDSRIDVVKGSINSDVLIKEINDELEIVRALIEKIK